MLNFTVKPGECFTIGEEIRVVILGGTPNNIKVMVDAPRSYNIVRGKVLERKEKEVPHYYPEPPISKKAMQRLLTKQRSAKG